MVDAVYADLVARGHSIVAAAYAQATGPARDRLRQHVAAVDFEEIAATVANAGAGNDVAGLMNRAQPPRPIQFRNDRESVTAVAAGERALQAGAVGLVVVAGGQGSRLGFKRAKGLFPIGPLSERTLFEFVIDHVRAVSRRYGRSVPLYVMTSPSTHAETLDFFRHRGFFGLPADDVFIFCQGLMPTIDAATGELLLADPQSLAFSPDGHGGMLAAIKRHGGFEHMRNRGVRHLFYCQIDNPLTPVCDPEIIGQHVLNAAQVTTLAVRKTAPQEKLGNIVVADGKVQIVEYSDLPAEFAGLRLNDNSLKFWAGNIAVHLFSLDFLHRVAAGADSLPLHCARKQIETCWFEGTWQTVKREAIKFERFIFDILPLAERSIVLEGDKAAIFAPVKNADGEAADTPEIARQMIVQQHVDLLRRAGVIVQEGIAVEVNPLWAFDEAEVRKRLTPGTRIAEPKYFDNALWQQVRRAA